MGAPTKLWNSVAQTDEPIHFVPRNARHSFSPPKLRFYDLPPVVPNLSWLIPLCADRSGICGDLYEGAHLYELPPEGRP